LPSLGWHERDGHCQKATGVYNHIQNISLGSNQCEDYLQKPEWGFKMRNDHKSICSIAQNRPSYRSYVKLMEVRFFISVPTQKFDMSWTSWDCFCSLVERLNKANKRKYAFSNMFFGLGEKDMDII
jgi:hypothetical protein